MARAGSTVEGKGMGYCDGNRREEVVVGDGGRGTEEGSTSATRETRDDAIGDAGTIGGCEVLA